MEFGYEHPDLLPPYCTVCKRLPLPECSNDEDEFGASWCATSDPTVTSSTRIWFRIFDMLGVSGNQGKVCYDCHDLVEQFDVAKSQLKVLQYLQQQNIKVFFALFEKLHVGLTLLCSEMLSSYYICSNDFFFCSKLAHAQATLCTIQRSFLIYAKMRCVFFFKDCPKFLTFLDFFFQKIRHIFPRTIRILTFKPA